MPELITLSPALALEVQRHIRDVLNGEGLLETEEPGPRGGTSRMYRAKVTTAVTAATSDTALGQGEVEIYKRDSTNTLEAITDEIPVYNAIQEAFAVNDWVFVQQDAFGDFYVMEWC